MSGKFLQRLRDLMEHSMHVKGSLQAYVIPHDDAHMSEYIEESDKRLEYATGFTGSAGTAIVTPDQALLWTDGRYHSQAEEQLDLNHWTLMKAGLESTPTDIAWLISNLGPGSKVGIDPTLVTFITWLEWEKELTNNGHCLVPVTTNLVDVIWEIKPPFVPKPIKCHSIQYAGAPVSDKIASVIFKMNEKEVDFLIISALDEIAWLLNLRGSDVSYNPVFFAYLVITQNEVHLFSKNSQVPEITDNGTPQIHIHQYNETFNFIKHQMESNTSIKKVWIPNGVNYLIYSLIPKKNRFCQCSPILLMKAIKNESEIDGMTSAHIKDGVALCRYFAWLEKQVPKGGVTEMSAADKLEQFRRDEEHYVGPSFPTISSSGPNSAIIHYQPTEKTDRPLSCSEIYLCDSGAQFLQGTTDVTRTLHFGSPSQFEKECFTRVFKGQTALARAIFPHKLKGNYLDSYARKALWEVGLDYPHGTSHGVGSYLHVHEGPMAISWREYPDDPGLQANMILSNEPGYYQKGEFGIRLENIVQVVTIKTPYVHQHSGYLTFKTLTLVPIQTKMLDPKLLHQSEIDYLNQYHTKCRDVIGSILSHRGEKEAYEWLMKETQALG